MFTGLVEEIGIVKDVRKRQGAICFIINAEDILEDLAIDDSINVNGVCLTVISVSNLAFEVEAVEETLRKTTLGSIRSGSQVNLERALKFSDRMGGHFVQGHVDSIGKVTAIASQQGGKLLSVKLSPDNLKYVISEGSIAIDGVSLTIARLKNSEITISLIPHTLGKTTLGNLAVGDSVNIEVDLIGKYVESILKKSEDNKLSEKWLRQIGYPI